MQIGLTHRYMHGTSKSQPTYRFPVNVGISSE